ALRPPRTLTAEQARRARLRAVIGRARRARHASRTTRGAHVTQYEPPAARTSRAPAPAPRSGPLTLSPAHARPRSGQRAHRIPGGKHQRLALQRGTQLLGQMLDVDQHLEHVLIEPGGGHGEVPRLTHLATPTALHPPTA